jgi:putative toxin-antitoxin system antitoxin component (TIGR02293 family)
MEKKKRGKPRKYTPPQSELSNQLEEPIAAYAAAPGSQLADPFEQIKATRKGLAKSHIYRIADLYGATLEEVSSWLQTSYRNLQRKPDEELLDSTRSEKLMALGMLYRRGVEVLGSGPHFREWLRSPLLALGNQCPHDFLDTNFGIQHLERLLGRLEWGVFS